MAFDDSGASSRDDLIRELVDRVKENSRRIRDLEQNTKSFGASLESIEKRIIKLEEEGDENLKNMKEELDDITTDLMKVENTISKIKDRLEDVPSRIELDELKNFIDLISPMQNEFITEDEARSLINKELQKR